MLRKKYQPLSLLALGCLCFQLGCISVPRTESFTPPPVAKKPWEGDQAIRLSYRIDAGEMGAPLAVSCVQAKQVSYQEVEASPISERSVGVLDIQYPHPANRPGMALVGVVVQRQHGPERGMPPGWIQRVRGWFRWPDEDMIVGSQRDLHEAGVMDTPRAEPDKMFAELETSGFYEPSERRRGHVRVSSRIGSDYVAKDWSSVTALDGLMHRVRSQGQLVSYQGISMPLENRPSAPQSLVAWRAIHQEAVPAGEATPNTQIAQTDGSLFGAPGQPGNNALLPETSSSPAAEIARLPQSGSWR